MITFKNIKNLGAIKLISGYLKKESLLKTWVLVLILAILLVATATALRQNNLGMIERRNKVVAADISGDQIKLDAAISDLGQYVGKHMNTTLKEGIALQGAYDREVTAITNKFYEGTPNDNKALYDANQAECMSVSNRSWEQYAKCIEEKTGLTGELSAATPPVAELFYVNFATPTISLDLAGILLITSVVLIFWIAFRLMIYIILRLGLYFCL